MKRTFLSLLFVSLFLSSCSNKKEYEVTSKIAKLFKADDFRIEHITGITENSKNIITLTLINFNGLKDDYPREKIASTAAFEFLHNIGERQLDEYSHIKIVLENNSKKYEQSYSVDSLKLAAELLRPILQFLELFRNKKYTAVKPLFDNQQVSDSMLSKIERYVETVDSIAGEASIYVLTGFKFDKMMRSREPVLIAWAEGTAGNTVLLYDLYVSIEKKKIISGNMSRTYKMN